MFRVDSCVGRYFLPFAERVGDQLPTFDFRVLGVSTISADLHKFGYAAKGASTLISRDGEVFRHQEFRFGAPERRVVRDPEHDGHEAGRCDRPPGR